MTDRMTAAEWEQMKSNVQKIVASLEICWKCQCVAECAKHIIGNVVMVWLCTGCAEQMERPRLQEGQTPRRTVKQKAYARDLL